MTVRIAALACVSVLVLACGGKTTSDRSGSSSTAGAATGEEKDDAARSDGGSDAGEACRSTLPHHERDVRYEDCRSARAYLECKEPDGLTRMALSDEPTLAWSSGSCSNRCDSVREYAVGCGSDGDEALLASGCHRLAAFNPAPKGQSYLCCPCGT